MAGTASERARCCATGLDKLTERVIDIMKWLLFAAGISLAGSAAFAQDQDLETTSDLDDGAYPLLLDGTLSGHGDLKEGTATKRGFLRFDTRLSGWEAWKEQVRKNTGISFGGSLGVMWQNFSDTTPHGDRDAVGGKLNFNISRDLINAGTPEALTLAIVIEDRQPVGTDIDAAAGRDTGGVDRSDGDDIRRVRSSGHHPVLHSPEPVRKPPPIHDRQALRAGLHQCLSLLRR